jgi:hypothetical protein
MEPVFCGTLTEAVQKTDNIQIPRHYVCLNGQNREPLVLRGATRFDKFGRFGHLDLRTFRNPVCRELQRGPTTQESPLIRVHVLPSALPLCPSWISFPFGVSLPA